MNCHNGARYLAEAIDSIYAQTFQDFEIIFYDNVSTDDSAEIAARYDERLKIIKNTGKLKTLGHARREAVKNAAGEWLAFLDTDDVWLPHKLETQLSALDEKRFAFSYAGIENIDASGASLGVEIPRHSSGYMFGSLLYQFEINMPTAIVSNAAIDKHDLSFDDMMEASEEYNLFMQIAAHENILVIKEPLAKYRIHGSSLTFEKIARWAYERRYTLEILEHKWPDLVHQHKAEFTEAQCRACYYEACGLMHIGKTSEALAELEKAYSAGGTKYLFLYWLAHVPPVWRAFHNPRIKAKVSAVLRPFL